MYKKRLCRYSVLILFIQCIYTVHFTTYLPWKFGEIFFFFLKILNSNYSPGGTVTTEVTVFFGLSFVLFFLLYIYILFY